MDFVIAQTVANTALRGMLRLVASSCGAHSRKSKRRFSPETERRKRNGASGSPPDCSSNPSLSATEEKKFLELQLQTSQAIKAKLDSMSNKSAVNGGGVKGFVSGLTSSGGNSSDVEDLKAQQTQQINSLQSRLDQLK